eukprot:706580-Amorphochlora_amoeboformis.AAC.1
MHAFPGFETFKKTSTPALRAPSQSDAYPRTTRGSPGGSALVANVFELKPLAMRLRLVHISNVRGKSDNFSSGSKQLFTVSVKVVCKATPVLGSAVIPEHTGARLTVTASSVFATPEFGEETASRKV